ncbi:MAG: HNH endonuclease domain-containing protein [Sarcina sp.]
MLDIIDISIYKNIDIKTFQGILDESLTTSYKILWFKGVLEEVTQGNREITFEDITVRMIVNSWFPIVQYKLSFGASDQMKVVLNNLIEEFNIPLDIKKDKLLKLLKDNKFNLRKEVDRLCKYVPYRLLSPFYKDKINGTDYEKQKQMAVLNDEEKYPLYKIDLKNKTIKIIDDEWFVYLYSNQKILKDWVSYKYINFVQRRNLSILAIPMKLDFVSRRELAKPTKVWKEFLSSQKLIDIYTGFEVKTKTMSLDYFIPWSFVMHDELWNLIPTPKNVNSAKNDKLPNLDELIDDFCEVQFRFVGMLKENKSKYKKALESYLEIDINVFDDQISKEVFIDKLKNTIIPLYQIANNQGFEVWDSLEYTQRVIPKEIKDVELIEF